MDNIQKSEIVIAKILEFLMEHGIQDGSVSFTDVVDDPELEPFVAHCFHWLEAEGIVRARKSFEAGDGFSVINPSLTSQGFQRLGQPILMAEQSLKFSEAVRTVSKQGKSFSQIGDFFGGLLGGFTKSIGS